LVLWQQVSFASLLLLAAGILLRRGWLKLLGPAFLYELVRSGRRSRYILLRLYVYFILFILLVVFLHWWVLDSKHTLTLPADQAAEMVRSFFFVFMSAHLLLVVLVTPGYTAGAIDEEKDRRTLEAVLATDLRNREIVLSKLVVRLANLGLMLLTGLPVVAVLQFLGGIEPDLVLAALVVMAATMTSLASLSFLNSVYARRARDAVLCTYLEMAAYALVSGFGQLVHATSAAAWIFDWGRLSFTVGDAVDWFSAGNPLVVLSKLLNLVGLRAGPGGVMATSLPVMLRDYTLFHGFLALLFGTWAAMRLRAVFLKQVSRGKQISSAGRRRKRRRVGNWPMVWKEIFAEPGLHLSWFSRILVLLLIIASFVPALIIIATFVPELFTGTYFSATTTQAQMTEAMSHWTRIVGAVVACLLLVGVAVRGATSISSERDRLTWDSLLTSPLESVAILFGKWLGSLVSIRWGWMWLAAIWGLGSALGGLHILAIPVLLLACVVYAGLLATVGLWFSLVCQTNLRAIIWTLFTILAVAAGFLVLPLYSSPYFLQAGPAASWARWLHRFEMGMAPPIVLGRMLPFGWTQQLPGIGRKGKWETDFALLGLMCWAVAGVILWVVTRAKFRRITGR
jgi:ABC-type transport system involved in multi-copper enzyme maturation permease subunit